jgi:HD-GYP domain-containing protein (c-di-GMP phosphodiesterase class II)
VSGWWGGALAAAAAVGAAAAANLVGDEISGRLDLLPRVLIWLAGRRVPAEARQELTGEWLAELAAVLRPAAGLPLTRLIAGTRFAAGLLCAAKAVARELDGLPPRSGHRRGWVDAALAAGCGILTAALCLNDGKVTAVGSVPALLAFPLLAVRWAMARGREELAAGEAVMAILCQTIEVKDLYTMSHCQRVSERSVLVGRHIGMRSDRVEALRQAALLHDAGKLGVASEILTKTDAVTEEEYAAIQLHCSRGLEIGRDMGLAGEALLGIMHHHERFDGRGYPMGFAGDEIPEFARLIAVADAFDAMTTARGYRRARTIGEAVSAIREGSGSQFDPVMVEAFICVLDRQGWPALQRNGGEAAA